LSESPARVVGLYHQGRQIGFARAVSDGASVTYLADVYVLLKFLGFGPPSERVMERPRRP
jgi:hypothetical protein